jgi:hypothetical protein
VAARLPFIEKFFILPVLLENSNSISDIGSASDTPAPNIASTWRQTFSLGSMGKGFK